MKTPLALSQITLPALLAAALLAAQPGCAQSQHGKPRESLKIGDTAPDWGSLPATDGKSYSMADFPAKVLVVVFACNHCPTVRAYEDRIIKLTADFRDQGVSVVVINPNAVLTLEQMKARAEEKKYNFPYLMDESQESGHRYGATNTPHFFILDEKRVLRYKGALDNDPNAERADKPYAADAIRALLAGEAPKVTETRPLGCTVKYGDKSGYRKEHRK